MSDCYLQASIRNQFPQFWQIFSHQCSNFSCRQTWCGQMMMLRWTQALPNDWRIISKTTSPCFPLLSGFDCKNVGGRGYHPLWLIIIFYVVFYWDFVLICLWVDLRLQSGVCSSNFGLGENWEHSQYLTVDRSPIVI